MKLQLFLRLCNVLGRYVDNNAWIAALINGKLRKDELIHPENQLKTHYSPWNTTQEGGLSASSLPSAISKYLNFGHRRLWFSN